MNLITKAAANANMTPTERAALKLLEGFGYVVLMNVIYTITAYLSSNGNIDYAALAKLIVWQVVLALMLSIAKYFKAQGDTTLATAIDAAEAQVAKREPSITPVVSTAVSTPPTGGSVIAQAPAVPVNPQALPIVSAGVAPAPATELFSLPDNYLQTPTLANIPVASVTAQP
jgi:hypothetical protein